MTSKDYRKLARVKLGSKIFTDTWTKLGILCIVVGYISSVFSFIARNFLDSRLVTILFLILTIFLIPMEYSLNRILLNVSRGNEEIKISEVTYYYDVPFPGMYKVEILKYVYLVLWSFIPFASVIKYYSYSMASFIKLDNEFLTADGCITRSRQMMNGHKFELFLLDISFIGWYFVVVFTLGMGYGYVYSYTMMARAVFYNKISGRADVSADINDNVEFYNDKEIVNEEIIAEENKFKKANPLDIFIIILLSVIMMSISSYSAYTSAKNRNVNINIEEDYKSTYQA